MTPLAHKPEHWEGKLWPGWEPTQQNAHLRRLAARCQATCPERASELRTWAEKVERRYPVEVERMAR